MAWHPQVFKLAIASSHDIVYIFIKSGTKATLNKTSQNAILSLAWRFLFIYDYVLCIIYVKYIFYIF